MTEVARKQPLLVVSAALVLALLAVAALLLWGGSDQRSSGVAADDDVLAQEQDGEQEQSEEAETLSAASVEVTYDIVLARDPFESIRPPEPVSEDTATEAGNGTTAGDGTTSPGVGNGGDDPTGANGSGDKEPGADICTTGSEAVCNGSVVVLTGVGAEQATVEVNGVAYAVVPGQAFAGRFQLLRISGECADFLYQDGDEADVFTLCLGDRVSK